MPAKIIEELLRTAIGVMGAWNTALESIDATRGPNGESFDPTKPISGLTEISLNDLGKRVLGLTALMRELQVIEDTALLPDNVLSSADNNTKALRTAIDTVISTFQSHNAQGYSSLDPNTLVAIKRDGNQVNFSKVLRQVYPPLQSALEVIRLLLATALPSIKAGLDSEVAALATALDTIQKRRRELADLGADIAQTQLQINPVPEAIKKIEEEAAAHRDAAQTAQKDSKDALAQIESDKKSVSNITGEAKALKADVDAYQTSFDEFSAKLAERNKGFDTDETTRAALLKRLADTEKLLEDTKERARAVLGEATVSGLSGKFQTEAKSLGWRMIGAQILFFLGIVLLFLGGAAILGAEWLSGLAPASKAFEPPTGDQNAWVTTIHVLTALASKLIFLLPPLFLIGFAAKWYAALFRLRTNYSYKYTVAASLPGFKLEAPEYAEAITASAFKELLFNPGEPNDVPNFDTGNAWLEKLVNSPVRAQLEKMLNLTKKE